MRKKYSEEEKLAFKILPEGMSISAVSGTLKIPEGAISCVKVRRKKRKFKWIWTVVIEYNKNRLITYEVENRGEETFLKVIEKIIFLLRNITLIIMKFINVTYL